MSTEKKVLRIDQLRARVVGQIEIDGALHDVKPMTFAAHQALDSAEARDTVKAVRAALQLVVPTLTTEQLDLLDVEIAQGILTLAGAGIEAVEKLFPNAVSPGGLTSPG